MAILRENVHAMMSFMYSIYSRRHGFYWISDNIGKASIWKLRFLNTEKSPLEGNWLNVNSEDAIYC